MKAMGTLKDELRLKKQNKGFTLTEILVVVAILLILLSVVLVSVVSLRRKLRQKELDGKAELVYLAAQNRISELRAGGYESLYLKTANGVTKLTLVPSDADDSETYDDPADDPYRNLYYVQSQDKQSEDFAAAAILPQTSVDPDLWAGNWLIEYNPTSGSVYAVFYAQDSQIPDEQTRNSLRVYSSRLEAGAKVGYYGGDVSLTSTTYDLVPDIDIQNGEKLIVTFTSNNPTHEPDGLTFYITVTDSDGEHYQKVVGRNAPAGTRERLTQLGARKWGYTWVMDSLDPSEGGFCAQTGLTGGTDISIQLRVTSSNVLVEEKRKTASTNSLFAYREGGDADTAYITYGRHLQNLDRATSGVSDRITKAVQLSDISFADDMSNRMDWYTCYTEKGIGFQPITNPDLMSYTGSTQKEDGGKFYASIYDLQIGAPADGESADRGLFAAFSGTMRDVTMTGTRILGGQHSGALIASASGETVLENCRVYLSERRGDLTAAGKAQSPDGLTPWLQGSIAGGLIGMTAPGSNVTIMSSFAATVIQAERQAGGLVGLVGGALQIQNAYSDCYLTSAQTGGIAGSSAGGSISAESFYTAGYQSAADVASGFVPDAMTSAKNGYSACSYHTQPNAEPTIYATAPSGAMENVYYLAEAGVNAGQAVGKETSYLTLSSAEEVAQLGLGTAFTMSSGSASYPYNLMEQGLSYYTYPRLVSLDHYGDWQAEFEDGTLVYFERYADGSYGFFGANMNELKDSTAVGDGYAVVLAAEPTASEFPVTVEYADGQKRTITYTQWVSGGSISVPNEKGRFYLIPLPQEVVNTDYVDGTDRDAFYQKITVTMSQKNVLSATDYWYNPHFAKTVTVNETKPAAPATASIRTARQLYALSRYYESYARATEQSAFRQELDIDYTSYLWTRYAAQAKQIAEQEPIGDENTYFTAEYDGGYHTVTGVSIRSVGMQIGLFGHLSARAYLHDLVFTARNGEYITTSARSTAGSRWRLCIGALAGWNDGEIRNCATAGFELYFLGYRASTTCLGGLVGANYGVIRASSADNPDLHFGITNAFAYVAGFAGRNRGEISDSYALGSIQVEQASNGEVWSAGFTADNNNGLIRRSYSATAITASGGAETYGFARSGGTTSACYYLDGGTYSYCGKLYAYNASTNEYAKNAAGWAIKGTELRSLRLGAFDSVSTGNTFDAYRGELGEGYPYPSSVTAENGAAVHYGAWPVQKNIGTLGVFYWEHEVGGSNSGYHFSYVGTSQGTIIDSEHNEDEELSGHSLCTAHDDGGVIREYGYGYFYLRSDALSDGQVRLEATDCSFGDGQEYTQASDALMRQMPDYIFKAYRTGDEELHLTSDAVNSTWTLSYRMAATDEEPAARYVYSVCPFFADAISLDQIELTENESQSRQTDAAKPGTQDNAYQVRSAAQLQYINWNYGAGTAKYSITGETLNDVDADGTLRRSKYPYLVYSEPPHKDLDAKAKRLCWKQSHDLDDYLEKGGVVLFTPIGSLYDISTAINTAYSDPISAYFDSTYDGQSYEIKNIEIQDTMQCIGVFGVTVGAQLKQIILYSDRGSKIVNLPTGKNWYCLGGLVGLAARRGVAGSASFENCTVSGYQIVDERSKGYSSTEYSPGWGGGCVGGLVGATNMKITRCTAVSDITMDIGYYVGYMNVRVGGIAGVCRGEVSECYAGGSIVSPKKDQRHTLDFGKCTSIWAGGLVGGIVMRDQGSLMQLLGSVTDRLYVRNSYSYVKMPAWDQDTWIMGSYSIASNGEMQHKNFTRVLEPAVYMENCYALASTAAQAEDYKWFSGGDRDWAGGVDVNAWDRNNQNAECAMIITNPRSPYLSYDAMRDYLLGYLGGNFGTVTTTEFGANIDGKYSFPGNDASLLGSNYPFPTILLQKNAYGATVNVHYGAWPQNGMYWETRNGTLDLIGDYQAEGSNAESAAIQLKLYSIGREQPVFTLIDDETGEELTPGETFAYVSGAVYDQTEGCFVVTLVGLEPGTLVVRAQSGSGTQSYSDDLILTVTAELRLSVDDAHTSVTLAKDEDTNVPFRITGAGNAPMSDRTVTWQVTVNTDETDREVIYFDKDAQNIHDDADIPYDPDTDSRTLKMTGFAEGTATIWVTCVYEYPVAGGGMGEARSSVSITAVCTGAPNGGDPDEETGVIGLSDGSSFVACGAPGEGTEAVYPSDAPSFAGTLFLYTDDLNGGLESFTLESATISTAGGEAALTPGEARTDGYGLALGAVSADERYEYRSVTVTAPGGGAAELTLTLRRGEDTYTLRLTVTAETGEAQQEEPWQQPDAQLPEKEMQDEQTPEEDEETETDEMTAQ